MDVTVLKGDCVEVMAGMEDASVDAVVCDPPYALEFMGKEWDGFSSPSAFQAWCQEWATETLRVLKPGGHLVAFGGSRTWHRLACAIEDAGFEVRDSLMWLYGSGFPKSMDVSKAIEAKATTGKSNSQALRATELAGDGDPYTMTGKNNGIMGETVTVQRKTFTPATPDAARWQGWGTALKPAYEPIVLARKPLAGTVAANVLAHGTGAINIDACRVEGAVPKGRWPANVVLGPDAAAMLDEQSGTSTSRIGKPRGTIKRGMFANSEFNAVGSEYDDRGGASRFFTTFEPEIDVPFLYAAKAPTKERPSYERADGSKVAHPTVKPVALMRWLVRLITPQGGTVLDPFAGSGATLEAAALEGFGVIGIERDPDYLPLIQQRIDRITARAAQLTLGDA